jgi:hypothetical protein
MFSEGLSVELQRLMLRTPKNISFKEYTEEAIEISDDLYRINLNSRSQERTSQRAHGISHQKDTRTPSPPEKMDWEPTKAGKASTRTSRPSAGQVKCYACGEKGHISKYCRRSSKARGTKVNQVARREPLLDSKVPPKDTDKGESDDSGKE